MMMFFIGICQVVSFLLVALGQNAWYSWCGPLAASFAFAIHWKTLDSLSQRQASWVSFFWFLGVSLLQLSWMTDREYQGLYIVFVYLLISLACAWQFSFFSKKIRTSLKLNGIAILGLCSLWTLMEWARLHFLCGFAFNFVGLSLSCHLFSLQLASVFGVGLLQRNVETVSEVTIVKQRSSNLLRFNFHNRLTFPNHFALFLQPTNYDRFFVART